MKRRANKEPIGHKVLTTWRIWRQAEQRDVPVTVVIFSRRNSGDADGEIVFSAEATLAGDLRIREEDTDLYRLQRTVTALVADSEPLTWQKMLLVTTRHVDAHRLDDEDDGAGLQVSFEPVQLAKAGDARFRRRSEHARVEHGWPGVGMFEGGWSDSAARSVSLLPDTPENRAALQRIVTSITAISARLRELMSPDHIANSVAAAIAGLPLLPGERSEVAS